jgi:hypothetical protein
MSILFRCNSAAHDSNVLMWFSTRNRYAWAFPIFLVGAANPIFTSFCKASFVVLYDRFVDSDSMAIVCSMLPTIKAWSKSRAIGPPNMLANGPLVAYSSFSDCFFDTFCTITFCPIIKSVRCEINVT